MVFSLKDSVEKSICARSILACIRYGSTIPKIMSSQPEISMLSYDVVEWGRPLEKIVRETPAPRGAEVLVRLRYCGVCHSDAPIRDGYFDRGGARGDQITRREYARRC